MNANDRERCEGARIISVLTTGATVYVHRANISAFNMASEFGDLRRAI